MRNSPFESQEFNAENWIYCMPDEAPASRFFLAILLEIRQAQLSGQLTGDGLVDVRRLALRLGGHNRLAAVASLPNLHIERDSAQEGHAILVCRARASATAEDFGLLSTVRTGEVAHILDHAENGDLYFLKHVDPFSGVGQSHLLRGRYDDRAR